MEVLDPLVNQFLGALTVVSGKRSPLELQLLVFLEALSVGLRYQRDCVMTLHPDVDSTYQSSMDCIAVASPYFQLDAYGSVVAEQRQTNLHKSLDA